MEREEFMDHAENVEDGWESDDEDETRSLLYGEIFLFSPKHKLVPKKHKQVPSEA